MIKSKRMEIPTDLEASYGLFLRRMIKAVQDRALEPSLPLVLDQADGEVEEALENSDLREDVVIALLALGFTVDTLLDRRALRRMLRTMVGGLDARTKQSLSQFLGRDVRKGDTGETYAAWVEAQIVLVEALIVQWAAEVGSELVKKGINTLTAATPIGANLAREVVVGIQRRGSRAERRAFQAASQQVLTLNASVVGNNVAAAGVAQYVWRTSQLSPTGGPDDKTRAWHLDLNGSVQRWDDPPEGGGTLADDVGHPQEGINCRCVAEIFDTSVR